MNSYLHYGNFLEGLSLLAPTNIYTPQIPDRYLSTQLLDFSPPILHSFSFSTLTMYSFNLIPIVIALLVATVVALPHDLMVNDEFTRDVGVVYPDNNFTGAPLYLMLHKQGRKCEAIVG